MQYIVIAERTHDERLGAWDDSFLHVHTLLHIALRSASPLSIYGNLLRGDSNLKCVPIIRFIMAI
jgi:hypothetical protein